MVDSPHSPKLPRSSQLIIVVETALALVPWVILLLTTGRGFDLTDESYYLLSYWHPEDATVMPTLFYVILQPLFSLVGNNVAAMRASGMAVWLVVSAASTWVTIGFLRRRASFAGALLADRRLAFRLALIPVSGAALFYSSWIVTPGYNWLTLVALTAFLAGFLMWIEPDRPGWFSMLGAAILAFSAAIVFWSKATSALLLILYPIGALTINRPAWRRLIRPATVISGLVALAIGLGLPLLSGLTMSQVFDTLSRGLEYQQILIPGTREGPLEILVVTAKKIGVFLLRDKFALQSLLLWLVPILIVIILVNQTKSRPTGRERALRLATILLIGGYSASVLLLTALIAPEMIGHWWFNVVLIAVICLAAGQYAQTHLTEYQVGAHPVRAQLWSLPLLGLAPVFVFGTASSYSFGGGLATFFPLLGLTVLLVAYPVEHLNSRLAQAGAVVLFVSIAWMTYRGSLTPYRQDVPVWEMDVEIALPGSSQALLVSEETGRYLTELRAAAGDDFLKGTPVIDLTGDSPGAIYALGGRAPGSPWLLGGYPGSDQAAVYALKVWAPEDLQSAWVLSAIENGRRQLSESILQEVGLAFYQDHVLAGTARRAAGEEVQALWRPVVGR